MTAIAYALIEPRPHAPRWPSVLPGLLALLFVGHAVEDDGWRSGSLYLAIVALSVIQFVKPTVLGWLLLLTPFIAFGLYIAREAPEISSQDLGPVAAIYVLPAALLLVGHPWRRRRRPAPTTGRPAT